MPAPPVAKFKDEELDFLVQFLELNPQLKFILNSDATTKLDKEAAWEKIKEAFNCASTEIFTAEELKSKWKYSKHRLYAKCYKLRNKKDVWIDKLSDNEKRMLKLTGSRYAKGIRVKAVKPVIESLSPKPETKPIAQKDDEKDSTPITVNPSPPEDPDQDLNETMIDPIPLPYIVSSSSVKEEEDLSLPFVIVSRLETNSVSASEKTISKKKKPLNSLKIALKPKGPLKGSKTVAKAKSAKLDDSGNSAHLISHLKTMNRHLSELVSTNRETLKCLKSIDEKQDKVMTLLSAALNVDDA